MLKTFNVLLDTVQSTSNPSFAVNTNDLKTLQLNITIQQNKAPLDLTNATVRLAIKKPDNNTVFQDVTVDYGPSGTCEVILDTQAYLVPGYHKAEVMIYNGTDVVAVTNYFSYTASKGILDDSTIESTTEFQAINQLVSDSQSIKTDAQASADAAAASAQTAQDTINAAKGTFPDLSSRLTNVDTNIGTLSNLQTSDKTSLVNAINANVSSLAERVKQVNGISPDTNGNVSINVSGQPLKYGELKMPSDFTPVLPCKIYRDNDGLIKHNMDFTNRYKNGTAIYVSPTGNDTTGNGSQGTPYRTLTKAVAVALAGTDAKYTIFSSVTVFNRDEVTFDQTVTNKTIAIVSTTTDRALISANAAYTWTLDGTGTYKTARSSVYNVSDYGAKDLHGLPVALTNATTLAACQSTKNTWYTDGTNLWVHRNDEAIPTQSSTIVNLGVAGVRPVLGSGGVVYFENFIFTPIESSNSLYVSATGTTAQGELCVNNCGFVGQIRNNDTANGLATQRIKNVYVFNCVSAYAQGDGFNYHFENLNAGEPQNCFVLEYNCTGYELGTVLPGSGSNNASSIHDGSNILRIGTVGYRNTGTTIIDVNGCYSILYDCKVRTPMDYQTLVEGQGAGFSFSKDTGVRNATLYLINCGASECIDALQIGTGTTAYINNFKYTGNISNNGTINYI